MPRKPGTVSRGNELGSAAGKTNKAPRTAPPEAAQPSIRDGRTLAVAADLRRPRTRIWDEIGWAKDEYWPPESNAVT